jgi:hypothetical protein
MDWALPVPKQVFRTPAATVGNGVAVAVGVAVGVDVGAVCTTDVAPHPSKTNTAMLKRANARNRDIVDDTPFRRLSTCAIAFHMAA